MARILVIEDDIHTQRMLITLLERAGHAAEAVFDGEDGLLMAKNGAYDVVLTDMHLADTDGLSIVKAIRERDTHILIIGISGGDLHARNLSLLHQSRKSGVDYAFKKPFEHAALLEAIEEGLKGRTKTS
jgi:DNA-binding response OmpR family regulator